MAKSIDSRMIRDQYRNTSGTEGNEMAYRVTAQTKGNFAGLKGIFERDITNAKNAKEAVKFFKEAYLPLLEQKYGSVKVLGAQRIDR